MTGKRPYSFPKTIGLLATLVVMAGTLDQTALANPEGGVVAAGSAVISAPDPKTLNIHQSTDKAIIDWRSFNIAVDETTQFFQPSSSSWTLNRVAGSQDPSQILGTLRANGNIVIVNPDGILFGPNSRVDVNGLVATTHDIRNDDFMAGRMDFSIPGKASASIVNQGNISIADQGIGAFVAPGVRNQGVIAARFGKVSLAAANGFTLDFYGDDLVRLVVGDEIAREVVDVATGRPMADLVKNEGRINADGGIVALSAATARRAVNSVVNNTGVIEARSIGQRNGRIILGARTARTKVSGAPVQKVSVAGKLDVSGRNAGETGGKVQITGEEIQLAALSISAEGHSGGGRVLAGGDYQGGAGNAAIMAGFGIQYEETAIPTASSTNMAQDVVINADALVQGKGGKVILWSDGATGAHGAISANGGMTTGDGGFIETSGKALIEIGEMHAVAGAVRGRTGDWLIDGFSFPSGYRIDAPVAAAIAATLNSGTNATILDGRYIWIQAEILKTAGGDATLNIYAGGNSGIEGVVLHQRIASLSGKLNVNIDADIDRNGRGGLSLYTGNTYAIETNGGTFSLLGDGLEFGPDPKDGISTLGGNIVINTNNVVFVPYPPDEVEVSPSIYWLDAGTAGNVTITTPYRFPNDCAGDCGFTNTVMLTDNAVRGNNVTITSGEFIWANSGNGIPEITYSGVLSIGPGSTPMLEAKYTGGSTASGTTVISSTLTPSPAVLNPERPLQFNTGLLNIGPVYQQPSQDLGKVTDFGRMVAEHLPGSMSAPLKGEIANLIGTILVNVLPANLMGDPSVLVHLQSYMSKHLFDVSSMGMAISVVGDAVANTLGDIWQSQGVGSTSIVLRKYYIKLAIADAYAALTTGAQTGGLSVLTATLKVSVGEIVAQTVGLFGDQSASAQGLWQLNTLALRVRAAAEAASARGDAVMTGRLMRQFNEAQALIKSQTAIQALTVPKLIPGATAPSSAPPFSNFGL